MGAKLAKLRKLGSCVCHNTGLLQAERVIHEDNTRSIKAVLCNQHPNGFADKALASLRSTGLHVETTVGVAREPSDD
jgi:hypothetical protein